MPSSSSSIQAAVRRTRVKSGPSGSSVTVTVEQPQANVVTKNKVWQNTIDFKARKLAKLSMPDNTFSYVKSSWARPPCSFAYNEQVALGMDTTSLTWNMSPASSPTGNSGPVDINTLNAKLIKAAKGNQWNIPIFLGEGRKTSAMVVKSATKIVRMAFALKRGDFGEFVKAAHPSAQNRLNTKGNFRRFGKDYAKDPKEAFSSSWLEYTYGWVPFMSDVRSSVNTLLDVAERPNAREGRVRARVASGVEVVEYAQELAYTDNIIYVYSKARSSRQVVQKASWRFELLAANIPGRFGLLNPLEVAWELVPFSFVADWFLPIGDYLSALDAPWRFKHLGGTTGRKITFTSDSWPSLRSPVNSSITGFRDSYSSVDVQRTPMAGIPSPSFINLRFDPTIGAARATSAVALLHQLFGKKAK